MVSSERSKRIEAKKRQRNRLRLKKRSKSRKSKKQPSFSKTQKVNEHEVLLPSIRTGKNRGIRKW